ncbi:MAG TPA: Rieske 2Fe-2S domain-containing protein [Chloroflexota bacterium]|nr:Rieske 2Fe-2S domain-containing protein [Chloroflexota bacterium]
MLTHEENAVLTRVGPGTPGGELLRRYWFPFCVAAELTPDNPTKFVRLLGEDLVAFRDKSGNVGLIQDHCAHRGASMLYGRVEERGISCAYHGWLYDTAGNCLETPAEPAESRFHLTVKMKAYPVRRFVGLYWAYLGPQPAPEIPKYDIWARKDGRRHLAVQPMLAANWFQPTENAVDIAHGFILHQEFIARGKPVANTTRGLQDEVVEEKWWRVPYGIMKRRLRTNGDVDEHPYIFPNILRVFTETQIRVPVDDTHTQIFRVGFEPTPDGSVIEDEDESSVKYVAPYKSPPDGIHPEARFDTRIEVQAQDHMAWETQGQIADRTAERLATSDRGIVMLREMMFENIARVQQGLDPLNVIRDPNHAVIDTNVDNEFRRPERRARALA